MPEITELESLVADSVRTLAEDFSIEGLGDPGPDTALYGADGPLDSMALVNLIADIEDAVARQYEASITLADEAAMSAKRSPFRNVRALAEAIAERMPS